MSLLLSVIIPVYKAERYLRQCVDSVLEQTFDGFEVILVDDGSPDGSGAICDEYAGKDGRVKVIHKENGGPTSARRAGAQVAAGAYGLFLDSDDYYDPRLFAHMAQLLEAYTPDAILFDGVTFDTPTPEPFSTALPEGLYEKEELRQIRDSLILDGSHQAVISYGLSAKVLPLEPYRRLQEKVPAVLYKGEDMAVSVPLLAQCQRVYVSHFCGYYYRCTPGSIMNTFREEETRQIEVLADYLRQALGSFYDSRIASFVALRLFDYLDRAMIGRSRKEYLAVAKRYVGAKFARFLKTERSSSPRLQERLVFFLVKHRMFTVLWLLRILKPRMES